MELYRNALRHFKWLSHSHEANSRSIRLYWILDMDLPGTFPLALGILMVVLIKSLHVHGHIIWKGRDGPLSRLAISLDMPLFYDQPSVRLIADS